MSRDCKASYLLNFLCTHENEGVERLMLLGSTFLVLIIDLVNPGIEATVDRISFQNHSLSKQAKDYGSAAELLARTLCATT